jgi:predicted metalloprotease
MQIRDWPKMYKLLEPAMPQEFKEVFKTEHATDFYEQFKVMVVESVKDYWKAYFNAKQAEQEAARQQATGPQPEPVSSEVPAVQAQPVA